MRAFQVAADAACSIDELQPRLPSRLDLRGGGIEFRADGSRHIGVFGAPASATGGRARGRPVRRPLAVLVTGRITGHRGGIGPAVAGRLSLAGITVMARLGGESAVEACCQVWGCARFAVAKGSQSCGAPSGYCCRGWRWPLPSQP